MLLVETIFDTLNGKAAIYAIKKYFDDHGTELPVMISGTITDASGRTLSGQTPEAFWNSIAHANPISVGFNCALGVKELRQHIQEIAAIAPVNVSVYPNAGLPNEFGGYDDTPEFMAEQLGRIRRQRFRQHGRRLLRHYAGPYPRHRCRCRRRQAEADARRRPPLPIGGLEPLNFGPVTGFVNIGERANVAGSAKFAKLIREGAFDQALDIARTQVAGGAQVIDVNMDDAMLDGEAAMRTFLNLVAAEPDISRVPVMVDSSKFSIIEAGLKCLQGKGVVNSISLKEGEDAFIAQVGEVMRYGAAVVVMAFDEQGQAETCERMVAICQRSYKILTKTMDFPPEDIIFDANIFPIATGIEEHNNFSHDFIHAVAEIKKTLPHALTSGGYPTCRSLFAATTRCARPCTRCSSITPSKAASTWPSSTPASWRSTGICPTSCENASRTRSSTAGLTTPKGCWRLPIRPKARSARKSTTWAGAGPPSPSGWSTRWSMALRISSKWTPRKPAKRPSAPSRLSKGR